MKLLFLQMSCSDSNVQVQMSKLKSTGYAGILNHGLIATIYIHPDVYQLTAVNFKSCHPQFISITLSDKTVSKKHYYGPIKITHMSPIRTDSFKAIPIRSSAQSSHSPHARPSQHPGRQWLITPQSKPQTKTDMSRGL